ncbi:MAG: RpiB/LacA/LacB family sugar-phosphate isomerase, partial [Blastocatellia bacterium]|nr:RpiB/LacA/LacB family sugar-phosphate isomerase [Blastocatellia bacterium]
MFDLSEKQVVTEDDIKNIPLGAKLYLGEKSIVTPLAADLIAQNRLEILRKQPHTKRRPRVALGSDHGGVEMKVALKELLSELGIEFHDFGTYDTKPVDYPDYAHLVAGSISQGSYDLGIIIDGAGIGSCMVANKLPGVRAALAYNAALARNSREHNDANVLTLGGRFISIDQMRDIVKVWISTSI